VREQRQEKSGLSSNNLKTVREERATTDFVRYIRDIIIPDFYAPTF
jgi:hypothetical protein